MNVTFSIPDTAPRRGNALTRWIGHTALKLTGWRMTGSFPTEPKFVVAAAPHRTALLDFSIGMMAMLAFGVRISFMIKHTVMRWPIRRPLLGLGAISINRNAAHGVVSQMAQEFSEHDKLIVVVMPEGTRRNAGIPVAEWKRGFYHIAHRSDVPIMPIYISYTHRRAVFGDAIAATGELDADLALLQTFFDENAALE